MRFPRVRSNLQPNRLARAVSRIRAERRPLIDLTLTNPTRAGIRYVSGLLEPLASPAAMIYDPQPFGLLEARAAVATDYERRGIIIAPERIVLTASTSEAYSFLFKLLCSSTGDIVMVPAPSYPLFDHLTQLDGVCARQYRLDYHGRWEVEWASLENAWSDRVRGVLAVSPNNPTGSVLTPDELATLSARCADRDAALILDEVFADYPLTDSEPRTAQREQRTPNPEPRIANPELRIPSPEPRTPALTFRLGGLSKSAGLPQLKLGWIAIEGPEAMVGEAMEKLELISDTYLSVSTPVQVASHSLITAGATIRHAILARIRENYMTLKALVAGPSSVELLHADAGWSAVIRVAATRSEEDLVLDLIEHDGVLVHPGFFFDFAHEAFVVVSLLPEPASFVEGVRRVLDRAHA
jgi:alanine-synthesizing transaminase